MKIQIIACLILLAGCSTTPDDGSPRTWVAVSNMTHPPFSSWDASGKPVGVEVELVASAAHATGHGVIWQEHPFGDLLDLVATKQVDIAAATIGITQERAERVAFTQPYFITEIVALVRKGPGEPLALSDLASRAIGVDPGTTAYPIALAQLSHSILVTQPEGDGNWGDMVRTGAIDAMIIDATDLERLESQAGVALQRLPTGLAEERFGLVVHPDSVELLGELNAAIERMMSAYE